MSKIKYKKGDKVKVLKNLYDHSFPIGDIVILDKYSETDTITPWKAYNLTYTDYWFLNEKEFKLFIEAKTNVISSVKTNEVQSRKNTPVFSGFIKYFPDAIEEVARVSKIGNDQHNEGQEIHWDRSKSTDEADALTRHLIDAGKFDTDGQRHSAKICWRALALLQKELEKDGVAFHSEYNKK